METFASTGDNMDELISIFLEFVKTPENKEFRRYVNVPLFLNLVFRGFSTFLYEGEQQILFYCPLLCKESRKPQIPRIFLSMFILLYKFVLDFHMCVLFPIAHLILLKSLTFKISIHLLGKLMEIK